MIQNVRKIATNYLLMQESSVNQQESHETVECLLQHK